MAGLFEDLFPTSGAVKAGLRAAGTGFGILLTFGGALGIAGTCAACFHAVPTFAAFGVNTFDYVSASELPTLGLRSVPASLLAFCSMIGMVAAAGWGALLLRGQQERHNKAAELHKDATWQIKAQELLGSGSRVIGYHLLPIVLPILMLVAWSEIAARQLASAVGDLHSAKSCTYRVTWTAAASAPYPPFEPARCATLVGMLGAYAVLFVDGRTHVVPRASIATMSTEPVPLAALQAKSL